LERLARARPERKNETARLSGHSPVGGNATDSFLIENTAGAVVAGIVVNGSAQYTYVTTLASDWSFHG
jgi:hypothetical protein